MQEILSEPEINAALPLSLDYPPEKTLFFDIETTGFSPGTSSIYLIGCLYFENRRPYIRQWFAETPLEESQILMHFSAFLSQFEALVHFNGDGFDIPFLEKKCQAYQLPDPFQGITSIDLYKRIKKYKKLLQLENLKQKSVEAFLGITRKDSYTGKDLISVYKSYVQNRKKEAADLLFLHNHDDIQGLLQILPVLAYDDLFCGKFTIEKTELRDTSKLEVVYSQKLTFYLRLDNELPVPVSIRNKEFYFFAKGQLGRFSVILHTDELKYFYPNYTDYYYLPKEDLSIHKSVAFYVDKEFRTKAKAANCYSKKTGRFLPQYKEILTPYFKIDYFDKITYFEVTEEFLSNQEDLYLYTKNALEWLL